jgi:signal peptidase II
VKRFLWPSIIILNVVLLDQITKVWAVASLTGQPSYQFLGKFVQFTLVYNVGGAMGTDLGSSFYYLTVALIILPILGFYLYQYRNDPFYSWPLSFIIAGAIGNVADRIRIGKVVDFIDVDFFKINIGSFHLDRWWTFNIADAAISCALVALVFVLLFHRPEKKVKPLQETQPTQPTL